MAISAAQQAMLDEELNASDVRISADQQLMIDDLPQETVSELGNGSMVDGYSMTEGVASSAAQGFTFGFSDELQALGKSLIDSDVDYKTARNEIRAKLAQFRDENGGVALSAEIAGAVIPSMLSIFGTPAAWSATVANVSRMAKSGATFLKTMGQTKTAKSTFDASKTANSLVDVSKKSAMGGFMYGLGASEKDNVLGMTTDAIQTALASAVLSPIIAAGGKGIANLVTRQAGKNKIDVQVRKELARLVDKTGLTEDDIIMKVMNGELMAENQSLLYAIKQMVRNEGKAMKQLDDELELRPLETRLDLMDNMQKSIGRGDVSKNLILAYKQTDDVFKNKERIAYNKVLVKNNKELSSGMQEELLIALRAFDGGADTIRKLYKLSTVGKKTSFYKEVDGEMVLTRTPTIADAEIIYRAIRNEKDKLFRSGDSEIAPALNEAMKQLKVALNKESPKLAKVREKAYQLRQSREAYKYGSKLKNKSPQEVEAFLSDLNQQGDVPAAMQSLRDGFLTQLKGSDKATIAREMADGNANLNKLIAMIFPEESLDEIIMKAGIASQAKNTKVGAPVTAGPQSTPLAQEALSAAGSQGMQDLMMRLARPVIQFATMKNIKPETALEVVRIVTSQNPDLVKKALKDDNAMTQLQKLIADMLSQGGEVLGDAVGKVRGSGLTQERDPMYGLLEYAKQGIGNMMMPTSKNVDGAGVEL